MSRESSATTCETPKRTPLFDELKSKGGKFVSFAGYEMPIQFDGIKKEHHAVRNQVGLFDVSHMGEIWIEGPDALGLADYLTTNNIAALEDGQAAYTPMCFDTGGIVDDLLVYRFRSNKILLVVNAANRDKDLAYIQEHSRGDVTITDRSDNTGQLALQGPKAMALFETITNGAFNSLPSFRFTEGEVAGAPCIVSRTGYTGEDGVEIYCENKYLVDVFRAIVAVGEPFGLALIGLGARDTLRLEARLSLYGNDLSDTTSPLEAGLGWTVKLDAGDFIGKSALVAQKEQGLARKLVGFEMVDKGIARHGYPVIPADGDPETSPISTICSGGPSPTLNKNIGLVYLPRGMTKRGSRFGVIIRGKVKTAKVVKTPFYKSGLNK